MDQQKNVLKAKVPLVSVVIPTYNMAEYINEAVDSVLNQTYKSIEVIVIDDGSKDNTKEVLKRYDSAIKYIYQENKGASAARNTGVRISKGEFIAFLDADDIWLSGKLSEQMKLILSDNSIGLVSCSGYEIGEEGKVIRLFQKTDYASKGKLLKMLCLKNIISGGSEALVRKECFDKVGRYDESLVSSLAEDWDLWLRIAPLYNIRFISIPLVKIRVRANSLCSPLNAEQMLCNELQILKRVFSSSGLKFSRLMKQRAYSYRYYSAAVAYKECKDIVNSRRCLKKSFLTFPLSFFQKSHLVMVLYAILGNIVFERLKN